MTGTFSNESNCTSCGEANQPGMRFCMNCGESLAPKAKGLTSPFPSEPTRYVTQSVARPCHRCGKTDELNNRFCVFCGADTVVTPTQEEAMRAFLATRDTSTMETPVVDAAAIRQRNTGMAYKKFAIAAVLGLVFGYGASFLPAGVLQDSVIRSNWPSDGLVLYVSPGNSQVLIEDESGRSFTLGRTSSEGTLTIPDLPPGNYSVTVSAPGYVSRSSNVRVNPDEVAVVGYPVRVNLSRDVVSSTSGPGGRS
jgi:hypothetical protein